MADWFEVERNAFDIFVPWCTLPETSSYSDDQYGDDSGEEFMSKHVGINVRERDSREAIATVAPRDVGDIAGCKTSHIEIGSGLARSSHLDEARLQCSTSLVQGRTFLP